MCANEESLRSFSVLEGCYLNPRPKALLNFAKENGILEYSIQTPAGKEVPAPQYCMELYYNALTIAGEQNESMQDQYQIVSLLLTMERMRDSSWSFGSELRYELAKANIRITRTEYNALLAQQGDFSTKAYKPDKSKLMQKNILAVSIYCAEIVTLCGSLHGVMLPGKEMPKNLAEQYQTCWKDSSPKDSLEAMMQTFCPEFLKETSSEKQLATFMEFLRTSDFYYAPASTKYHGNFEYGLSIHNCCVLARMVAIVKPQTAAELGRLILMVVSHDLCKTNVYEKYFYNKQVSGPAIKRKTDGTEAVDTYQTKHWSDGSEYHYEEKVGYRFKDSLPQGHGQKSMNMMVAYFEKAVDDEMAAAVDGHMRDYENNPYCDVQLSMYPMCRYLHIADVMATMLDEEIIN